MFSAVRLKNGTEVPKITFITTKMNLEVLVEKDPNAFYELVEKCRNPKYEILGDAKEIVEKLALMRGGLIHDDIRNTVLSLTSNIIPDSSVEEKSSFTPKK